MNGDGKDSERSAARAVNMRLMVPFQSTRALLGLALAFVGACGGVAVVGHGADAARNFVGTWTFESGMLTPACPMIMPPPFSLVGLSVRIAEVDDKTITVQAGSARCSVTFAVDGNVARALPDQHCELDTGALLGVQNIAVTSWTLTRAGERITSTTSGAVVICAATGSGVLVPQWSIEAPDGGADASSDGDASGGDGG